MRWTWVRPKPRAKKIWLARYRTTMVKSGISWETDGWPVIEAQLFPARKHEKGTTTFYDMDGDPAVTVEELEPYREELI